LRLFLFGLFLLHSLLLFLPIRVFCEYVIILEVLSLFGIPYIGYVGAKAIIHKNEGALFLAFGIGLSILTGFYDFLIDNAIFHGPQLSNISIFVCTFLISAFISWRFSKAFSAVKSLSAELTQANIELSSMDLSMIFSSTKRLAGLVSDILDFSRLKDRDIQLAKKPVDINSLTDLVLTVSNGLVGDKLWRATKTGCSRYSTISSETRSSLPIREKSG
jgi:hypothetical protein